MKTVLAKTFGAALAIAALAVALPAQATVVSYTVDGWGPHNFPGSVADTPTPAPPSSAPWGADGYPGCLLYTSDAADE